VPVKYSRLSYLPTPISIRWRSTECDPADAVYEYNFDWFNYPPAPTAALIVPSTPCVITPYIAWCTLAQCCTGHEFAISTVALLWFATTGTKLGGNNSRVAHTKYYEVSAISIGSRPNCEANVPEYAEYAMLVFNGWATMGQMPECVRLWSDLKN